MHIKKVEICINEDSMKGGNRRQSIREMCPNTEFFLVRIFLYSVRIQENTDQKKRRIWKFLCSECHKLQTVKKIIVVKNKILRSRHCQPNLSLKDYLQYKF